MYTFAIVLLLSTAPMLAHAETIFKCETTSGVEFRDTACPRGGGTTFDIKDSTPQQEAAARASLAKTREEAEALTAHLEAQRRARNDAAARDARYAEAPIIEPAPVAETAAYPPGYPCPWAECWVQPLRDVRPRPAPLTAPPPSIPAHMRKRAE